MGRGGDGGRGGYNMNTKSESEIIQELVMAKIQHGEVVTIECGKSYELQIMHEVGPDGSGKVIIRMKKRII